MRAISTFSLEEGTSTFCWRVARALRIRVKKSATGSVKLILFFLLGCPFASPGRTSGSHSIAEFQTAEFDCAAFASRNSAIPQFRQLSTRTTWKPRESPPATPARGSTDGRCQTCASMPAGARTTCSGCAAARKTSVSCSPSLCVMFSPFSLSAVGSRLSAFSVRLQSPLTTSCLSSARKIPPWPADFVLRPEKPSAKNRQPLRPERHTEAAQQRPRLVVVLGRGHNCDVHSLQPLDLGIIDLREEQLVFQPQRIIAAPVKGLGGHSAKVAHARQPDIHQPVKKFVHAVATQGDHHPDRHAFAHFEGRNRLLGLRDHRFLTGNLAQLRRRRVQQLALLRRLAHAHVDHDLFQARYGHGIAQLELLHQRRTHFFLEALLEPHRPLETGARPRRLAGSSCLLRSGSSLFLLAGLFLLVIFGH